MSRWFRRWSFWLVPLICLVMASGVVCIVWIFADGLDSAMRGCSDNGHGCTRNLYLNLALPILILTLSLLALLERSPTMEPLSSRAVRGDAPNAPVSRRRVRSKETRVGAAPSARRRRYMLSRNRQ